MVLCACSVFTMRIEGMVLVAAIKPSGLRVDLKTLPVEQLNSYCNYVNIRKFLGKVIKLCGTLCERYQSSGRPVIRNAFSLFLPSKCLLPFISLNPMILLENQLLMMVSMFYASKDSNKSKQMIKTYHGWLLRDLYRPISA